jgi:hypothetical protein
VQRHLWRLAEMGVAIRGHGEKCITRETGGWLPADDSPTHQTCPCCKRQEWHGSFCSGCGVPTGAADWRSRLSDAQRNHLAGLNARSGGARATAPGETPEVGQAAIWPDTTPSAAFAE